MAMGIILMPVGGAVGIGQPFAVSCAQSSGNVMNSGPFDASRFLSVDIKSMGRWIGNAWLGMTGQAGKLFTRASEGDPSALHRLGELARKDWGVVHLLDKLQAVDTMRELRFDGTLWASAQMILSLPSHTKIPCTILRRQASLVDQVAFLWTAGGLDALFTKSDLCRFRTRRPPPMSLKEIRASLEGFTEDPGSHSSTMPANQDAMEPSIFYPADALSSLSVAGNKRAAKYLERLARRDDLTAQDAFHRSIRKWIRIVK